ncbi:MAG: Gfo/Idh/MocA family oxidoreductase [SAR202 cluster bacterium]|nr:Gfo/Idh/MocA family oxidoreductase [SAR202 cluster bacterium]MDP6715614.1 Gfo/Idh/MocA family oxidoreductase [SAR202 cluster bacterium]
MAIGWGIISTGNHPDRKVVPAMNIADDTDVVAAYSRDMGRAQAFAQKHGIANAYDSLDDILADPVVDAVFISSPNFVHVSQTIAAAEAGKHVLVEKPMAVSVEEAADMVRACRDNGVKLGVGFQLRFHPGHQQARQLIEDGVLGTLSMIQGQWCLGGRGAVNPPARTGLNAWWGIPEMIGDASTLMGTGVHVMDLLQSLVAQPIVEVAALTDGQTPNNPLEQSAVVSIRFGDGTLGSIVCGRRMPDTENDAMIYGSDGRIALRGTIGEAMGGSFDVVSETVSASESYEDDPLMLYKGQTEAFNRAIQNDEPFHASGEDGLSVVEVTSAIIESARTGRAVKVERASQ